MPGGIDYSKWDHLDEYSDDDDQGVEDQTTPRVTRLDGLSQVTFGGLEGSASISPSHSDVAGAGHPKPTREFVPASKTASGKSTTLTPKGDSYQIWKENGGEETIPGNQRRLFWSQDRYSVCIRIELGNGDKVDSVIVGEAFPFADRFCAVGTVKPKLTVKLADTSCLVEGELPHPVHLAQDEDEIEWSVERSPSDARFVAIALYKAVPMQGLSLWWRRPFMSFDEIELGKESTKTSNEFLEAWEEAHRLFREKRASD